jgi:hypothetical protein
VHAGNRSCQLDSRIRFDSHLRLRHGCKDAAGFEFGSVHCTATLAAFPGGSASAFLRQPRCGRLRGVDPVEGRALSSRQVDVAPNLKTSCANVRRAAAAATRPGFESPLVEPAIATDVHVERPTPHLVPRSALGADVRRCSQTRRTPKSRRSWALHPTWVHETARIRSGAGGLKRLLARPPEPPCRGWMRG